MQGKKREQQCIEEQWQTITDTTPEAASAECRTEHADSQKQARPPLLPPLDAQHNVTRLTDTSHVNLKNQTDFDKGNIVLTMVDAQSLIKETMPGMTQECDLALITHQENSILDSNDHSTNKTPTNEDTEQTNPTYQPPSSAQFRIPVKTNKEGVVVLDGSFIPYVMSNLNVAHVKQY